MNKQLEETACLYVLDQLDSAERNAFEAQLLCDPEVAGFVRDLEPAVARAIRGLPQSEPPAGTLDRIEARIAWDRAGERAAATPKVAPPVGWFALARWGIAAVIAVSLATLAVQSLRTPAAARPSIMFVSLDSNRNTFAELPLTDPAKDADARFIELASLAENFWRKPDQVPVNSAPTPGHNRGYALFDPTSRQGFIVIENLPVAAESERYHLWIVDPKTGRTDDAGVLPMSGVSRGLYSFALAPGDTPKSARPNFLITVEAVDAATSPAEPRGRVVLGGRKI